MSVYYRRLVESVDPLPSQEEGLGTAKLLYKLGVPKKVRKKAEDAGARAAASDTGQAILKKGGYLTLPTRVASKVKVRMSNLKKKLTRSSEEQA